MIKLFRVHYLDGVKNQPHVHFEYADTPDEALTRVLERDQIVSEVSIKAIKNNRELLEAADEIEKARI